MTQKNRLLPLATALGLVAAAGMAASSTVFAHGYVMARDDGIWRTSSGECWKTGAFTEADAIPECTGIKDSDGDGVYDDKDQCPDTPKGDEIDANGCSLPKDSDGDGVMDPADRCPGTARGVTVDTHGCEVIEKIVIQGILFEFDSATLTHRASSILDEAVTKIKRNIKHIKGITVTGHTDSSGSEAYNMGLSQRRAQSVADYLSSQGVSPGKITVEGKGESMPIADNGTKAGRAANRRVEIDVNM
jgi:OOP family OmpA-OmpF porin